MSDKVDEGRVDRGDFKNIIEEKATDLQGLVSLVSGRHATRAARKPHRSAREETATFKKCF